MSARLKSLSWILLVGFAAMAASLAQRSSLALVQLHAGTQPRGRSGAAAADQAAPADLAMAFQTITRSVPGADGELWRDAVADSSPAGAASKLRPGIAPR
ncbi:MAG: hypothetical protein NTY77_04025 [Elusimicrobia bacterium]|nr:hypothetical protein [Elusimicrobiota bacterium]